MTDTDPHGDYARAALTRELVDARRIARLAESDDDAARQREMADHVRGVGQAWLELADSLEAFADYLDTLPVAVTDDPPDPPP